MKMAERSRAVALLTLFTIVAAGGTACGGNASGASPAGPYVYWAEQGAMKKVNVDGGTVATVANSYTATGMAADSSYIYFHNSNGLNKVPKANNGAASGLNGGVLVLTPNMGSPTDPGNNWMAVDATSVYWVEGGNGAGAVKKVPLDGGAITTLASGLSSPVSLAIDGGNVYWTDRTGFVNKVGIAGGTVTTLYDGTSHGAAPNGIAVDAQSVYWGEATVSNSAIVSGAGAIKKIGVAGGAVATLASGLDSPTDLTVDSQSVYWIEYPDFTSWGSVASIMKVGLAGGSPTPLASGQTNARGIVSDTASVYWLDSSNGTPTGTVQKVSVNGSAVTAIATGLAGPNDIVIDR